MKLLVLLLVVFGNGGSSYSAAPSISDCPTSRYMTLISPYCYWLEPVDRNFADGMASCNDKQGTLAVVRNKAVYDWLAAISNTGIYGAKSTKLWFAINGFSPVSGPKSMSHFLMYPEQFRTDYPCGSHSFSAENTYLSQTERDSLPGNALVLHWTGSKPMIISHDKTARRHYFCEKSFFDSPGGCPESPYSKILFPYCYWLVQVERTFDDAMNDCNSQDGTLAVIRDKAVYDWANAIHSSGIYPQKVLYFAINGFSPMAGSKAISDFMIYPQTFNAKYPCGGTPSYSAENTYLDKTERDALAGNALVFHWTGVKPMIISHGKNNGRHYFCEKRL